MCKHRGIHVFWVHRGSIYHGKQTGILRGKCVENPTQSLLSYTLRGVKYVAALRPRAEVGQGSCGDAAAAAAANHSAYKDTTELSISLAHCPQPRSLSNDCFVATIQYKVVSRQVIVLSFMYIRTSLVVSNAGSLSILSSVNTVSRSRAFQPRLGPLVERLGNKTTHGRTLSLIMSRRAEPWPLLAEHCRQSQAIRVAEPALLLDLRPTKNLASYWPIPILPNAEIHARGR